MRELTEQRECACGCQQAVSGRSHGREIRFVHGHNARGTNNRAWKGGVWTGARGYTFVRMPGHPRNNASGYVPEHTLVAEMALGKHLPDGAVVHHVDENKQRNVNGNLVICQDEAYHQLLHRRTRALAACGNADWYRCMFCKQYADPCQLKLGISKEGRHITAWHRECVNRVRVDQRRERMRRGVEGTHQA